MHTITLVKHADKDYLVLVGGLSFENGFNKDVRLFNLTDSKWQKFDCKGTVFIIPFGHSTVDHALFQSLYVFGGYSYEENKIVMSNKIFALD